MLYNVAQKNGFLYHALGYNKRKRKALNAPQLVEDEIEMTAEEKDETIKYFKRCVLPNDLKNVEQKMRETKTFRRKLILESLQKYQECWQFYFVCPDLVCNFNLFPKELNEYLI